MNETPIQIVIVDGILGVLQKSLYVVFRPFGWAHEQTIGRAQKRKPVTDTKVLRRY